MNFRKILENTKEESVTIQDVQYILEKLDLSSEELSDITEGILSDYVLFRDELNNDQLEYIEYEYGNVEYDEEGQAIYSDDQDDDDEDGFDDEGDYDYNDNDADIDEAFIKQNKGVRVANNRQAKRARRNPSVKRSLKLRSKKMSQCKANQRVTKVGPNVFKCVAKNAKDRKKSIRLKKFKKLYRNG